MRTQRTLAAALAALVLASAARAQETNPFEAYEKAAKPGAMHKKLEPLVGDWTWTGKFWTKPDDKPMESKGTCARKWVMGGRFVQDDIASKGPFGDFQGQGLTGYDNTLKKYVGTWIDTLSSGIARSVGTVDKSGKVFTYENEATDPVAGKSMKGKDVIRIVSDEEHVLESFKVLPDGKEMKVMELTYKRARK